MALNPDDDLASGISLIDLIDGAQIKVGSMKFGPTGSLRLADVVAAATSAESGGSSGTVETV